MRVTGRKLVLSSECVVCSKTIEVSTKEKRQPKLVAFSFGGDSRSRTDDFLLANQAL